MGLLFTKILQNMNNDKSIYACYEEIKQREINELKEAVQKMGGSYSFSWNERPYVLCNFKEGPVDVGVGSVAIERISDLDYVTIYDTDGRQICFSDIEYGHVTSITESIPTRKFTGRPFHISSLSREDLEENGFDTSDVDDETMQRLADKLGDDYCEQLFWVSLDIIAESMGIPKKSKK